MPDGSARRGAIRTPDATSQSNWKDRETYDAALSLLLVVRPSFVFWNWAIIQVKGIPHGSKEAEYPDSLGRRHRDLEHQPLQSRHDGLSHTEHRPHCKRGRDLHRLLLAAELHRRARVLHLRPKPYTHGPHQGWHARRD